MLNKFVCRSFRVRDCNGKPTARNERGLGADSPTRGELRRQKQCGGTAPPEGHAQKREQETGVGNRFIYCFVFGRRSTVKWRRRG